MAGTNGTIFLSRADLEAAAPEPIELIDALERVYASRAAGGADGKPKTGFYTDDGNFFFGSSALSADLGYAICHAAMGTPLEKAGPSGLHMHCMDVLSDYETAAPVAVMDAMWIGTMLPACVTAVAGRRLARPESRVAGFVAGGAQARFNLDALRATFPLERVAVHDARREASEAFARHARSLGLEADVAEEPRAAVAGCDIVITSVPNHPKLEKFLDPDWLDPGSFTSMVDLARSWLPGIERLDRVATDDHDQARTQFAEGRLVFGGPYDSDLAELVSGARPPRGGSEERAAVIHPGHVVGTLALAALLYERAREMGLGLKLPTS